MVQVCTLTLKQNILKICEGRNDKWAVDIKCRLNCCVELVASDAMYHLSVASSFKQQGVCLTKTEIVPFESTLLYKF